MTKYVITLSAVFAMAGVAGADGKAEPKERIQIEMIGTLKTGLMAIGGETTGTVIAAAGASFEVQVPKNMNVEKLDGKLVKVTGTLTQKEGVEVKLRRILVAEKLDAAGDKDKEAVNVVITGKVKTGIVAAGGATTGTEITAAGVTWELDLSKDKEFQKLAEQSKDATFIATGTLEVKKGAAAPPKTRWIVTVTSFKLPEGK